MKIFPGIIARLHHIDRRHSFDLRFCGEHRDTSSGLGLGRWPDSCSAGFPSVPEECGTITSLSLCKRKLDVSSSQDPISTRKLVALCSSKNRLNQETFSDGEDYPLRHQKVFLGATNHSSDSLIRNFCEIYPWGSQRPHDCGSEISNPEARM